MNATSDERLVVMLEARVRDFEKNMQRAEQRGTRSYQRLRRDSRTATQGMEQDMIRSTGRINQALAATSSKIGAFGKAFAGGAIAGVATAVFAGLTSNITQTVKGLARVGDEAKRAGMGLQAFQEWSAVAERTRVGMDALVDGFKELSLRADEFIVTGGGSASEAFKRLGYSAADLKQKLRDPSALMLEIMDRVKGLDSGAQIRIFDEMLGGTGGEQFVQLIDRGADGIRQIMEESRKAGVILDEALIRKAQDIDERFTALTQKAAAWGKALAVALADLPFDVVETRLNELFPDEATGRAIIGDAVYDRMRELRDLTDDQVESVGRLKAAHTQMGDEGAAAASAILMAMTELNSREFPEQRAALSRIAEEMRAVTREFESGAIKADEFTRRMDAAETEAGTLFTTLKNDHGITLSNAISAVGRLGEQIAKAIGLARTLKASLPGGVATEAPGFLDSAEGPGVIWTPDPNAPSGRPKGAPSELGVPDLPRGGGRGGGKSRADDFARSVEQIREQTRALEAEAVALIAVAEGGQDYGDALEYARKRAELLNAAQKAGNAITPELKAEIDALAAAYVTAGQNAEEAADRLERMRSDAERGADAISGIFGSVLDGSKSAKQAIAELLMEMAKVQLQKGILGLAESSGGKGLFGFLGSLLGGKRAAGGPVSAGVPYLVNENTPRSEVFVPSTSGGILNVQQAQAALRGGSGGKVEVAVRVDQDGNWKAVVERISGGVVDQRAPGIAANVVQRAAPTIIGQSVSATYERAREVPIG